MTVQPDRVAEAAVALREILEAHRFDGAVAGHASAGNLHFTLVFDPADPADVHRYAQCIEEVVDVVLDRFDGSLKGEHGTGRNMAPFVEREWGSRLTQLMRQVKQAIDPRGILGEGVLFTDDPHAHLRNLKDIPSVHPELDRCIECGFCEPVCPSRDSPRPLGNASPYAARWRARLMPQSQALTAIWWRSTPTPPSIPAPATGRVPWPAPSKSTQVPS